MTSAKSLRPRKRIYPFYLLRIWRDFRGFPQIIFTKKLGGRPMLIFLYNFKDQVRFLEILIFNIQGETFRSIFLPKVEQICIEMH